MQNQKLDAILESFVAVGEDTKDKLLGAAFCVVNKDGILYEGSAGRIDLPVDSPPFTTQSFTWVASMTKIVTAAAAMQEVERGGLGLDQDMRPLVPQLAQMEILRGFEADGRPILEPNANPITLRHLLTHTAGLGYDAADPDLARWSKAVGRTASAYDFSLDGFTTPLKFPSGEGWWYGAGLDWAAEALAAAASARKGGAKTRLADLVQEGILDPLGMQSTTFYSLKAGESLQRRKVATSYRDPETGTLSIGPLPVPSEPPVQSGGGGLWTTCEDFSKFLRAVLVCSLPEAAAAAAADAAAGYGGADAAGRRRRILRPETVAEMLRPQLDDSQREALRSVTAEYHDSMVPEFERTTPLDHGISGIINLADVPSKRKAGSMMWKGFTNGQWWIDPKAGIAAALVVNVLPQPDPVLTKLHDELERAVYSDLI